MLQKNEGFRKPNSINQGWISEFYLKHLKIYRKGCALLFFIVLTSNIFQDKKNLKKFRWNSISYSSTVSSTKKNLFILPRWIFRTFLLDTAICLKISFYFRMESICDIYKYREKSTVYSQCPMLFIFLNKSLHSSVVRKINNHSVNFPASHNKDLKHAAIKMLFQLSSHFLSIFFFIVHFLLYSQSVSIQ